MKNFEKIYVGFLFLVLLFILFSFLSIIFSVVNNKELKELTNKEKNEVYVMKIHNPLKSYKKILEELELDFDSLETGNDLGKEIFVLPNPVSKKETFGPMTKAY